MAMLSRADNSNCTRMCSLTGNVPDAATIHKDPGPPTTEGGGTGGGEGGGGEGGASGGTASNGKSVVAVSSCDSLQVIVEVSEGRVK